MSTPQAVFTTLLIVLLLALAVYYAWRQRQTLRRLQRDADIPDEERIYLRNQAWRRLAGSGLMFLFAALLGGSFCIEDRAQKLAERSEEARAHQEELVLSESDRAFRRLWAGYWIVLLVGVLAILVLAGYDFWATRVYGLRHFRQLQADRRAMIAREIAMRRRDRNGFH